MAGIIWMMAFKRLWRRARWSSLVTLASLLSGCLAAPPAPAESSTPVMTAPALDTWEILAPGLERRSYRPDTNTLAQIIALRVDPARYSFRVHYHPGDPLDVQRWRDALPDAVAFVNGNFFTPEHVALGLLVADGVVYGQAYQNMGGMFQVQDGRVRVRSTIVEPYVGEALEQAVQAFPMLILDGQAVYASRRDRAISRRTVVGQDSSGRIVLLVTPLVGFTLPELSAFLATTDLDLVNAVNLDGGGSSLLYVGVGELPFIVRSFDAVPAVLAVYQKVASNE